MPVEGRRAGASSRSCRACRRPSAGSARAGGTGSPGSCRSPAAAGSRLPGGRHLRTFDDEDVRRASARSRRAAGRAACPPGPTNGTPCLSSLAPGRLADEHQVGVRVARAEDDGLAGRGELRAARADRRLPVDGLELLAALVPRWAWPEGSSGRGGRADWNPHAAGYHAGRGRHHHGTDLEDHSTVPLPSRYLVRELDRNPSEPLPCAAPSSAPVAWARAGRRADARPGSQVEGPLGRGADPHADVVLLCVPDAEIAGARPRP